MKKMYIICFLSVLMLAYGAYKITYLVSVNKYKNDAVKYQTNEFKTVAADVGNTNKISTVTKFVYETYNVNTGEITSKTYEAPVKYLGFTKEMLAHDLKEKDMGDNVLKLEILSFSKDEVVMRETIAYEITADYFIKMVNETLVIYLNDRETVYDYADINKASVPEIILNKLNTGMYIESDRELYEFLQNYSS